jgi:hypothetical protein
MIEIKDFVLEPSMGGRRFNLYRKVQRQRVGSGTTQSPNGEFYEDLSNEGFDMDLHWCLETIIQILTVEDKDITTCKQYLDRFEEIMDTLYNLKFN